MRTVAPAVALLTFAAVGTLAAQGPRPGANASIPVTATVVPVTVSQQSARLLRTTLSRPLPRIQKTRREGLSWVTVEHPPRRPRRITINYLAN